MIFPFFGFDAQSGITVADIFTVFSLQLLLLCCSRRWRKDWQKQQKHEEAGKKANELFAAWWTATWRTRVLTPWVLCAGSCSFMLTSFRLLSACIYHVESKCDWMTLIVIMNVSAMWRSPNKQTPHRKLMAGSLLCTLVHTSCFAFKLTFKGKNFQQIFHFPGWPSLRLSLEQLESVSPMEKRKDRGHSDTR